MTEVPKSSGSLNDWPWFETREACTDSIDRISAEIDAMAKGVPADKVKILDGMKQILNQVAKDLGNPNFKKTPEEREALFRWYPTYLLENQEVFGQIGLDFMRIENYYLQA